MAHEPALRTHNNGSPAPPETADLHVAVADVIRDVWRFIVDTLHEAWTWLVEAEDIVLVRVATSLLILAAAVLATRLTRRSLQRSAQRTAARGNLDDWQTRALVSRTRPISMVAAIVVYIVAVIFILAVWQLQTAFLSLLTAAGFAGIVIGIAASNSISNLIAGFMIFYNHPFDIGDWVEIEDMQGIVVDVKPGATVIESWDGEKITYPNRLIEGSRIKNKSHQRKLRMRFPIGVDYATDIAKARDILLRIIKGHPEVLQDPEPQVIAMGFGDSSINLELRYWIVPLRARVLLIQTWLMQEIQRAFAKEGIVIPFPQRTVVWRYREGNPPPGDTVSELAYDPESDGKPWPGPPLGPSVDSTSPYAMQERPKQFLERVWQKKKELLRIQGRKKPAQAEDTGTGKDTGTDDASRQSGTTGGGEGTR